MKVKDLSKTDPETEILIGHSDGFHPAEIYQHRKMTMVKVQGYNQYVTSDGSMPENEVTCILLLPEA